MQKRGFHRSDFMEMCTYGNILFKQCKKNIFLICVFGLFAYDNIQTSLKKIVYL